MKIAIKILVALCLFCTVSRAQTVSLIPAGSTWKYKDTGANLGTAWKNISYGDASWLSGNAQLGYGEGDEAKVIRYGSNASNKYITSYFRKSFTVVNPSDYVSITLNILRDDGAVVYLNGVQVLRSNMPAGTINYQTLASSAVGGTDETTFFPLTLASSSLIAGTNVLAVEIHQSDPASDDLSFDLSLDATLGIPCGVPSTLATTGITTSTATLNWSAVPTASSYSLRYRITGTTTWTTKTSTTTSKALTGLVDGSNYEFQVKAICSLSGIYSTSSFFSTLALSACGIPDNLSATAITSNSATVLWSAASGANSYTIRYRITGSTTWTVKTSTVTSKAITGLISATNYEYQVRSVCAFNGTYSPSSFFTTLSIPVCDTPTGLSANAITSTSATFIWNAVIGAGNYTIQYRPLGSITWLNSSSSTNSLFINGLIPSTDYEFQVQATCSINSAFSGSSLFTTLAIPACDIPTGLNVSAITSTDAVFNWNSVTGANGYTVQYRIIGNQTWLSSPAITNTLFVSNLQPGSDYEFQVQAICSVNSQFSASSFFTTLPLPTCDTPTGLNVTAITINSATLNWNPVSGASSYTIQYRPTGNPVWITEISPLNSISVNNLNPGSNFEFQVQANCSVNSIFSPSSFFATTAIPTCDIPSGLKVSGITTTSAIFNWDAVSGATNYNLQYRPIGTQNWIVASFVSSNLVIINLQPGTNYEFQVQAICTINSLYSASVNFSTLALPTCDIPTGLNASSITINTASLSWIPVAGAATYTIQYRDLGNQLWTTVSSATNSLLVLNLIAGTNYEFQVQANCVVNSVYSIPFSFSTLPLPVCGTPTGLNATSVTINSAILNWNPVSGAVSYTIQYRNIGNPSWTTSSSGINSISISNLNPSTNYEFQIQAVCTVIGSYSNLGNFTTLSLPTCGTPSGLNVTSITTTSAILNWSAVSGALTYTIQYRPSGSQVWSQGTSATNSFSFSNFNSGTNYEFQVQAVCAIPGIYSSLANFSTLPSSASGNDTLVSIIANWKYLDDGTNQGTSWRENSFNDLSWKKGNAELGYGDADEATIVSYGPNSSAKYTTTYFRKAFTVSNPGVYTSITLNLVRDDGAIVYINGIEVVRSNMPTGSITNSTFASSVISSTGESAINSFTISPSSFIAGTNLIAVEIHQSDLTSTDISLKARLYGTTSAPVIPVVTRGAYLNKLTPTSITIRWRTDIASTSRVQYGTSLSYGSDVIDAVSTTEHSVTISGLNPATKYFYSIGTSTQVLQGDSKNNFYTSPVTGSTAPIRIWAIGDFGDGSSRQTAVRDAYVNYTGTTPTNFWIWMGDNAYNTGTDAEYQSKVFNMYPDQFKSYPLYPCPGNHDYGNGGYQGSVAMGVSSPYFSIFSLPQAGEAGGIASGTPKYFSYNYGNVHMISLDSYGALNTPGSPMYTWLNNDLAANTQRWTIIYFHHPPYTKGGHDSDSDIESINIRTNLVPLFDTYHVDMVICGHSHNNERSYFMKGHYGSSGTFTNAMKMTTSGTVFTKTSPFEGTAYLVCGTSGEPPGGGSQMPCMYFYNNTSSCSVVIDINGDNLSCKYLASTGSIVDQFTITKVGARVSSPVENSVSNFNIIHWDGKSISLMLDEPAMLNMELMNALGVKVKDYPEIFGMHMAGFNEFEIGLENLMIPNGIYLLKLEVNGKSIVKKVIK